jgi:hypothetical protein
MGQLSERYYQARKEGGRPYFSLTELAQIKGTLEQCELELQKLHILGGAADVILGEAWQAFGFPTPERPFAVTSDFDVPSILPLGDGTVGVPDDGLAPTLTESG